MKIFLRLLKLFRTYWTWILVGSLIATITLLANVALVSLSGWFLTTMALAGILGLSVHYVVPCVLIATSSLIRILGRYAERIINHEGTFRVISSLRVWFYRNMEPLAPAHLQQFHSGEILSRLRSDIDALESFHVRCLTPILVAVFSIILFVILLCWFSPWLAAFSAICYLLAGALLPYWSFRVGRTINTRLLKHQEELRTALLDGLQGMAELKLYQASETQAQKIEQLSAATIDDQLEINTHTSVTHAATTLCSGLALCLVLFATIPMLKAGDISAANLTMLSFFILASFEAVAPLPHAFELLTQTLSAAGRIFSLLDQSPAVVEPKVSATAPERFDITFDQVSFSYPNVGSSDANSPLVPALKQVSFTLPQGQCLLIQGATGSGKSTLFNLLLKFWAPQEGNICIGGQDISTWQGDELRQWISVVSQHTHLFATTIRENLLLANPQASESELREACRIAQLETFIASLPEGLDTWVGETGVRLSLGQSRRLAIARAILKNAPVLLLDEPTEGLDGRTEKELLHALATLMTGKTVLLISHRLGNTSWIKNQLYLLQGRVAESNFTAVTTV